MSKAIYLALREMFEYFDRPNEKASAGMLETYLRHLEKFPEPAVLAAIDQAIGTCTFRPKIAEIADIIGNHAAGSDEIAETAWAEVQREAQRVGYNRPPVFHKGKFLDRPKPEFSSPLIAEAVASIGWDVICTGEKVKVEENFKWAYRNLRERTVKQVQRGNLGDLSGGPALPAANVRAIGKGQVA